MFRELNEYFMIYTMYVDWLNVELEKLHRLREECLLMLVLNWLTIELDYFIKEHRVVERLQKDTDLAHKTNGKENLRYYTQRDK